MQLTSLYYDEFDNKASNHANAYYDKSSMVIKVSYESTGKSTSKPRLPECVYGKPYADHDYPAKFRCGKVQRMSTVVHSRLDRRKPGHHFKQHRKRNHTEELGPERRPLI